LLQGLQILLAIAKTGVLGSRPVSGYLHFSGFPIEAAFITIAKRASPRDPFTVAVAGTVVYI
jgi:hypothetical protein